MHRYWKTVFAAGLWAALVGVLPTHAELSDGSTQPPATGQAAADLAAHSASAVPGSVNTIVVPDSTVQIVQFAEADATGNRIEKYAISLDGRSLAAVRNADPNLYLHNGQVDPLTQPLPGNANDAAFKGNERSGVVLVQFHTQPLEIFREQIRAAGGTVLHYFPSNAYLVRASEAARQSIAALPYVRWVGAWTPAMRLREPAIDGRYVIQVFERGLRDKLIVAERIAQLGGFIHEFSDLGFWMEATLTADQVLEIAKLDQVHFIDRWGAPDNDMDLVRSYGGALHLTSVADGPYQGAGVRGEVMDDNFRITHVDFASRPPIVHGARSGGTSHGTSTFGIVFGDGTGDANARGMLPLAQGIFADQNQFGDRHVFIGQLLQPEYQAVFQSNSWGAPQTTQYTSTSALMDDIIFDHDIIICQSQSNLGDQRSRPEAWAKNIVSVGGINHRNTLDRADDCWCGNASIGPAADGRIKPDLAMFYDLVYTVSSSSDTAYRDFCCTSAATPCVAGHFGLFFEMWHDGIFGNPTSTSVFASRPHSSTARAMMINTANSWTFTGAGSDLTRTHQGWGAPDLRKLHDLRDRFFIIDEADPIASLQTRTYRVTVPAATPELRITMVYLDPAGTPGSSQHRVNDLSLRATSPSAVVFNGNVGLDAGNWSTPGGALDTRNTVENIFVQAPTPGEWVIEVIATNINTDARLESPEIDADFALVVSGVITDPCAGFTRGDANCSGSVDFDDITAFVTALLSAAQYAADFPSCNRECTADISGDSLVDFGDIDGFVACLVGACP